MRSLLPQSQCRSEVFNLYKLLNILNMKNLQFCHASVLAYLQRNYESKTRFSININIYNYFTMIIFGEGTWLVVKRLMCLSLQWNFQDLLTLPHGDCLASQYDIIMYGLYFLETYFLSLHFLLLYLQTQRVSVALLEA